MDRKEARRNELFFKINRPPGLTMAHPAVDLDRLERDMSERYRLERDYSKALQEHLQQRLIPMKYRKRVMRPYNQEIVSNLRRMGLSEDTEEEVNRTLGKIKSVQSISSNYTTEVQN